MEGFTGDFPLSFGKRLRIQRKHSEQKHEELETSLDHISKSLKDIDVKKREMQYLEKKFQSTQPKEILKVIH